MTNHDNGQSLRQFVQRMTQSPAYQRGNAPQFASEQVTRNPQSPLNGKRIAFLGSSVTAGFAARGRSFVDYLVACDGIIATKSAVSGTTLASHDQGGYLVRLQRDFPTSNKYDLFVCQLSTNDNRHGKDLGHCTPPEQRDRFDETTTLGAIERICQYVGCELHCPLAFYTCLQDDSAGKYATLIQQLQQLAAKWNFAIIDLFHNQELRTQTAAQPDAMFDDVHPTQEGYYQIWLPVFEKELTQILASKKGK